jgi:hypothetical protein
MSAAEKIPPVTPRLCQLPYELRGPTPADLPLVVDAWWRGARYSFLAFGVGDSIFRDPSIEPHRLLALRLMGESETLVAVEPGEGGHMLGFIVFDKRTVPTVHWLYVKMAFRRFGLAGTLFRAAFGDGLARGATIHATHGTKELFVPPCGPKAERQHTTAVRYRVKYNPYLLVTT